MSEHHPTNQATRVGLRFRDAILARDWDALSALFADGSIAEDRRAGLGTVIHGKTARVEHFKVIASLGLSAIDLETIEVRGERLALQRLSFHAGEKGSYVVETLSILEIDDESRIPRTITFDADNLVAAVVELDKLHAAGSKKPNRI